MTTRFVADYGKRASGCKKCKQQLAKGSLRLAKVVPNPFSESTDEMRQYYHVDCMFDAFAKARASTAVLESVADVEGYGSLADADKAHMVEKLAELDKLRAGKAPAAGKKGTPAKRQPKIDQSFAAASPSAKKARDDGERRSETSVSEESSSAADKSPSSTSTTTTAATQPGRDDSWLRFCRLCERIGKTSKYTEKTAVVQNYITGGSSGEGYDGDLYLLCKMLLPSAHQRVYNLKDKQLLKLFSTIFDAGQEDMQDYLNQNGDVSATVSHFYTQSGTVAAGGTLTLHAVDRWLEGLAGCTREADHEAKLRGIVNMCDATELRHVVRQIKKDLRMNAGAPHVLKALDPDAHEAYQNLRDLKKVVQKVIDRRATPNPARALSVGMSAGTPIKPMLAEPCRTVAQAMAKCPRGMYAEIKYDGERVQLHRAGGEFRCYSRSLKLVQAHKVADVDKHFGRAFNTATGRGDIVLDAEVLLIDNDTGKPLPFGTLGVHKQKAFSGANVCLFVFDMLMYDGKDLLSTPLSERKRLLRAHMTEVRNRIMLSSHECIAHGDDKKLKSMIDKAIAEGLEGLVLKDTRGVYEPGKRRWLKVKKDYLEAGSLADSADLVVLGAYYGTGNKGGLMSVFLMGVYDEKSGKWCTVTKCGNGHDDDTLDRINKELKPHMVSIGRDHASIPAWLRCGRSLAPDFVAADPKSGPVWEVTGAEFSRSEAHTAGGISIRFPRVTRIRDDKGWKEATSLAELKSLYAKSKERTDLLPDSSATTTTTSSSTSSAAAEGGLNAQLRRWLKDDEREEGDGSEVNTSAESDRQPAVTDSPADDGPTATAAERKPAKRPAKAEPAGGAKRPCKYGSACYQRGAEHRRMYGHPDGGGDEEEASDAAASATTESTESSAPTTADPAALFAGARFALSPALPGATARRLRRLVCYFGGDVADEGDGGRADYYVAGDGGAQADAETAEHGAPAVTADFVFDSVRHGKVHAVNKYLASKP